MVPAGGSEHPIAMSAPPRLIFLRIGVISDLHITPKRGIRTSWHGAFDFQAEAITARVSLLVGFYKIL
jgi:hypothetical protein